MKIVLVALGVLMVVAGGLWTGTALGWFGEASESSFQATVGPLVAGFGVALLWVVLMRRG